MIIMVVSSNGMAKDNSTIPFSMMVKGISVSQRRYLILNGSLSTLAVLHLKALLIPHPFSHAKSVHQTPR